MIDIPKTKLLFFDLETVGVEKDYPTLKETNSELARLFESYMNWFQKKFPDEEGNPVEEVFVNRSALVPEFAKIIVGTFSFVDPKGKTHVQTFSGDNEKEILLQMKNLIDRVDKLGFFLCGHNIKMFDIPMLGKRMVANGIKPPKLLPSYDTKPWEVRAVDTKDLWGFGNNYSISSLDLMCVSLGVESPKTGEVSGNMVHDTYWNKDGLKAISEYCERDVNVLVEVMNKIYELN
jgi:DNA polymerase elongation subunit (family B)